MSKLIILGRDGVINQGSDQTIRSADQWLPINGSLEAIGRLKKAGYLIVVVSNQPDIAQGLLDEKDLSKVHDKMSQLLKQRGASLDAVFHCPHSPSDNCVCRKPKPGLMLKAAKQFNVRLNEAVVVGDSISDIQAARMVGARAVLVKTGKGARTMDKYGPFKDVEVYENLSQFTREFLKQPNG